MERPHINMADPVPNVLPAMEEDAETTCATKVSVTTYSLIIVSLITFN